MFASELLRAPVKEELESGGVGQIFTKSCGLQDNKILNNSNQIWVLVTDAEFDQALEEKMRFRDLVLQAERFLKYAPSGTSPETLRHKAREFSESAETPSQVEAILTTG